MSRKMIVCLFVLTIVLVSSIHAQVVTAWDFNDDSSATAPGWKTFSLGASNSDSEGSLTLTQAATGDWVPKAQTPDATQENAPALLTAGAGEMNDGFDLDGTTDAQDFTLSGLTDGQAYRLQFIGTVKHTADAQNRNLTMSVDEAGTSAAYLLSISSLAAGKNAGYSEYIEFTADASQDVVITFGEVSSGVKAVAGLIVEEIEGTEPAEAPVITHTTVLEGGTNLLMTWTSKEGQLFDIVKSEDLKSWRIFEENWMASTSTQTTYTVALDEEDESQFYQVWSVKDVPPNIILLFADDFGFGDLACYGHPYAKTPNLDKLATEGTLFREFNVTGVTCNPSRTGILTSWHPNSYALNTSDYGFDQAQFGYEDHPTVMELLHDAGYKTGHFGKWHIGPDDAPGEPTNGTYGVDSIIVSGGGGNDTRGRDEEIYQNAIDFIVANQGTNFYMNVMGRVTHAPVDPRPDLVVSAGFADLAVDRADFAGQQLQGIFDGVEANGGDINDSMANYVTEVYYLDVFIGELLAKLDELSLRENTIIVFSSDQGGAVPDYRDDPIPAKEYNLVGWSGGLRGQKHDQHEGGIRVPFILRWPGYVPAGKINTESVTSALDWLPTLCGIAGVDLSDIEIQGEDVSDIWMGSDRSRNGPQFWNSSMKKDAWRIYFSGGSTTAVELYDLDTDFAETNNLVTTRPEIVAELTEAWADWKVALP
jgi:arylsulfatase A-like enzyme